MPMFTGEASQWYMYLYHTIKLEIKLQFLQQWPNNTYFNLG